MLRYWSSVPGRFVQGVSLTGSQVSQVIERIDPAGMPIGPLRLNGISADSRDPHKLKGCGREGLRRGFIEVAHNVGLAFASGAGAVSAQVLDGDVGLSAVIPF